HVVPTPCPAAFRLRARGGRHTRPRRCCGRRHDGAARECCGLRRRGARPVIRAQRGDEVKVRLVNGLDEPTTLHWHGGRVPSAMDGGAPLTGPPVAPGDSFDYRFPVPDAGTFWYRAARRAQQERGLYGALIVAETALPPVDQDHLLVFGDRRSDGVG